MATKLHFLGADVSLTKTFSIGANGELEKSPYPMIKRFTSYEEEVRDIDELARAVTEHAAQGHCLLKGLLDRPLVDESRAGHTCSYTPTTWMVLDNDGLDFPPDRLMSLLGYGKVPYFLQYSASAGVMREADIDRVTPNLNRYHIFVMLEAPESPDDLKLRLKKWNLTIPELRKYVTLTATKMSLRWPLDVTVCQNDKLIYIAPPVCNEGVIDTLTAERFVPNVRLTESFAA